MIQSELWHDTVFDALGAAVQAAGGVKKVAGSLWPSLDMASASSKLRSALSPDHAQKLCLTEFMLVWRLSKEAGDNSITNFCAREIGFEAVEIAPAEAKKRAKKARKLSLLNELKRLEDEE